VFENRVLRRMLELVKEEVTGRRLEEIRFIICSLHQILLL
jgi:hypothetical protein